MSLTGPRSWAVAVICSVLNFLHLGTARLSGSMYLAVLERYQVERSKASLPFILCYTVRNISGPLVGYLATKFGIYTVTMLGGLLAFVGMGGCFFAEDIIVVTLFWGVVFGFGFGLGSVLIPEILNQHFDKYVSNANGIAFGGECVAGFVLPIFLKFSIATYGTSGTFLLLSAIMLHSIPAALLLKYLSPHQPSETPQLAQNRENLNDKSKLYSSPNRTSSDSYDTEEDDSQIDTTKLLTKRDINSKLSDATDDGIRGDTFDVKYSNLDRKPISPQEFKQPVHVDLKQRNLAMGYQQTYIQTASKNRSPMTVISEHTISRSYPEQKRKCKHASLLERNISTQSKREDLYAPIKYYGSLDQGSGTTRSLDSDKNNLPGFFTVSNDKSSHNLANQNNTLDSPNVPTSSLPITSSIVDEQISSSSPFKIFLDPAFCVILLTQSTMLFNATMLWTVIVDFSRDTGMSSSEEIYILIFLSVLDMAGRLGLGWITDGGYVSNSTFSGVCCFGMGISVGALVFFRKVATIGCSVSFFGLCLGGFLIVCPGVVNDHIPQPKRGMALASRFFLFAPMSLSQSPLIGYFRGKLGSYNVIFIIVAILCLFGSVTSLLTPYAEKCRERRNKNSGVLGRNIEVIVSTVDSVRQLADNTLTKSEQPLQLVGKINRAFFET